MELASIPVLLAAVQNSRQAGRRIAGRLSGTETLFPTSPQSALQLLRQSLALYRLGSAHYQPGIVRHIASLSP